MTQIDIAPTAPAVEISPAADSGEAQLTYEVGALWQAHAQAQTTLTKSRQEMKVIRDDLSCRLYELKSVLSRPGRGGTWSRFLATGKIPRSSADRLVRAHEKTLAPQAGNCASEQISESVEVTVRKYLHASWPRMSRVLTSPELVEVFIAELRSRVDKFFSTTPSPSSGS